MEDSDKTGGTPLPQLGGTELQGNDLMVLQQFLSEVEPLASLYTTECLDPLALRFIPENTWTSRMTSLQALHEDYFGRKNNVNRRFEHKLWNALQITAAFPNMTKIVGVMWVTETIIKVYKYPFAKLLNITAVDGGLFHKQGNFTRHGFVPVTEAEARASVPAEHLLDVNFRDVLLLVHQMRQFTMTSSEVNIATCRWDNPVGAARTASLRIDPQ